MSQIVKSNFLQPIFFENDLKMHRYILRFQNVAKRIYANIVFILTIIIAFEYPERLSTDSEIENLIRRLYSLDERSLDVIKATANALLETAITSDKPKK